MERRTGDGTQAAPYAGVCCEQYAYYRQQAMREEQADGELYCRRRQEEESLQKESAALEEMSREGVLLTLDGTMALPKDIVKVCMVQERGSYMRDYIADSKGKIVEVRFDRLTRRGE